MMTDAQDKCIEYHLWKRPDSIPESDWITSDQWNLLKSSVDKWTATLIVGAFKRGDHKTAINQLLHLI